MTKFNTKIIKKVQTQSLTSVIYDQLEDMILTGKLKPGERINESQLSAQLEVSRAPIREACRQLEKHGMVQIISRRGTFVANIAVSEVKELYDIRASLETLAAEKAAVLRTSQDLEEFRNILKSMQETIEADDAKRYFQANMIFHRTIMRISGNRNLEALIEGISNKASLCRKTNLSLPERMSISYRQHKYIFKAIEAGNPMEASTQMKHHIIEARDALLNTLDSADIERADLIPGVGA
jgi:DNA-binding GntR family transcriptional regulator